jgi:hypothetical protein
LLQTAVQYFKEITNLENWNQRVLEEILREAQKVYVKRDKEKQNKRLNYW